MNKPTSITGSRKRSASRGGASGDLPALFRTAQTTEASLELEAEALAAQLAEAKALLAAAYQKLIDYRREVASTVAETVELRARLKRTEAREAEARSALEAARNEIMALAEAASFAQQLLANSDEEMLRRRWWQKLLRL
jgi:chromosome segregation ATPase